MNLTIYHNPRCSKSRQTLALLQDRGIEPTIVKYLDTALSGNDILSLARAVGVNVKELLRRGETEYKEHRAQLEAASDQDIARWLSSHPRVLERPVVVNNDTGQAALGRPPENVLKLV